MAHRTSRVVGVLFSVIAATLVATATPALAHNSLKSSDPKADSVLDAAPAAVTLTFTEELTPGETTLTVTGPDGAVASGDAGVAGATVSVPFRPTVPGAYKVAYRVTGHDGDATSNSLTFTLSAAAVPTTTTAAPNTTTSAVAPTTTAPRGESDVVDSDTQWWPVAAGVLALVALGVLLAVRRKRAD
ncbi:copper resistance CopC family protein [Actinokineospora xionganensis]|uniref:Copper resistance protein CopC n=1 Tax=Actinokineospora xionganensis TaxID=2684470 RepID=A0ABR7LBV4_9PSEU|nr:copper resistance CopC family protein [Actinokineospora xionganensis]MBC6449839.1 copper resistance protein CopC [Actinokineospora xionganensis]